MAEFNRSIAIVVGINQYQNGIPPLKTAVADAHDISQVLRIDHGYEASLLTDGQATLAVLRSLLTEKLPTYIQPDDRLVFYFAGHGLAFNGDEGPEGYLIPQDATLGKSATYLPMTEVHDALTALHCRHFLGIFDCCFAGAFRWSATRDLSPVPEVIHRERYERFLTDPAWQVITSAADDQKALDALALTDHRGQVGQHSPFAQALIEALQANSVADSSPPAKNGQPAGDGVITATELYQYLRDAIEPETIEKARRQTPGLWPLNKHGKGEFIFLVPGRQPNLPAAPLLNADSNPYRGLEAFEEIHQNLFFGRQQLIKDLQTFVETHSHTVVLGASGTGKSSLVKAGLVPALKRTLDISGQPLWQVLAILRPGATPLKALVQALQASSLGLTLTSDAPEALALAFTTSLELWRQTNPQAKLLLVIDQAEELFSLCRELDQRQLFLQLLAQGQDPRSAWFHVVFTLRSDFEPQFRGMAMENLWSCDRFLIRPMNREELRTAIEAPASAKVIYFDPPDLVDRLIDEVNEMPGALPLLSFTLRELFLKYLRTASARTSRAITMADYEALGGIKQALVNRADEEYQLLVNQDPAFADTIRRVMLRLVATGGTGNTRRQVLLNELDYPEPEGDRVNQVLTRFKEARLLVSNTNADGEPYVEPAHDALVEGWPRLLQWLEPGSKQESLGRRSQKRWFPWLTEWGVIGRETSLNEREKLLLQRRLTPAAIDWQREKKPKFLWHADARLPLLKQIYKIELNWFNSTEVKFIQCSLGRKRFNIVARWLSLAVIFTILVALQQVAQKNAQRAIEQRNTAVARQLASQAEALKAQRADFLTVSSLLAIESFKKEPSLEAEQTIRQNLALLPERILNSDDLGDIKALRISPDGQYIASLKSEGEIDVHSISTGMKIDSISLDQDVKTIDFSPNSSFLTILSQNSVVIIDIKNSQHMIEIKNDFKSEHDSDSAHQGFQSITFSPNSNYLAIATYESVAIWDLAKKAVYSNLESEQGFKAVVFSSDGSLIATSSLESAFMNIWTIEGQVLQEIAIDPMRRSSIDSIAFSPNSKHVAVGSYFGAPGSFGQATVFEVMTGNEVALLTHQGLVASVAFKEDGKYLVSGSIDGTAKILDIEEGKEIAVFSHEDALSTVSFYPDSDHFIVATEDGTIHMWNMNSRQEIMRIPADRQAKVASGLNPEQNPSGILDISLPSSYAATSNDRHGFSIWKLSDVSNIIKMNAGFEGTKINGIAFSLDGKHVAASSGLFQRYNNVIQIWNTISGAEVLCENFGDIFELTDVQFLTNKEYLIARSSGSFQSWKIYFGETEKDSQCKAFDNGSSDSFMDSPYSTTSLSSDGLNSVEILDNRILVTELKSQKEKILSLELTGNNSVEFSPSGKYIVATESVVSLIDNNQQRVHIWDIAKDVKVTSFEYEWIGIVTSTPSVQFTPDEKYIFTRGPDKFQLRETLTGSVHIEANYENNEEYSFAFGIPYFSPDSRFLAIGPSQGYFILKMRLSVSRPNLQSR